MKTLFLTVFLLLSLSAISQTQVKQDANGNYVAITVKDTTKTKDQATGKFFIDSKGQKYPIYKSSRGNLYYVRISKKTGNPYRVYIKPTTTN